MRMHHAVQVSAVTICLQVYAEKGTDLLKVATLFSPVLQYSPIRMPWIDTCSLERGSQPILAEQLLKYQDLQPVGNANAGGRVFMGHGLRPLQSKGSPAGLQ